MNFSPELEQLTWPAEGLRKAIAALGQGRGWINSARAGSTGHLRGDTSEPTLDFNLANAAAHLGLETEAVETDYAGVRKFLARCAPAILRLPGGRFVPVLRRRGRHLQILDADLKPRRLPVEKLRKLLCRPLEDELACEIDTLIAAARVEGPRRARARAALLEELLAERRFPVGWLLRPAGSAPLGVQSREYRVRGLLPVLFASHALAFLLWLGAWWLLGEGVFSGQLDTGWLQAFALLLLTLVPLRLMASGTAGVFAIRAGALLKRRLLAGALRLEPEEIRHLGVGCLLGCTLEAETLEQMAVAGGFVGLTGLVELAMAGGILALAPEHGPFLALAGWSLAGVGFGALYLRRQRRWTETRIALTDTMVEGMVGHRTRAVQEARDRWNEDEDPALADYYRISRKRDQAALYLRVLLPRGGFLIGITALVPGFAAGAEAILPLALSLGGVLAAHLAFRHIGEGLEQVFGAWVAFEQIRPFWRAATRPEILGHPDATGADPASGGTLVEARNLVFRHAGRNEPALRGVDISIGIGDRVLLAGCSGSGKSTLAAILAGQRRPEAGLCLAGGLDFASLGERGWRRRIALALQFHENHILMGTLAFNLLLGRGWPPTRQDLEEAEALCRALGLRPLLERMPGGLLQYVGETGWQLSHGERERIYLARALLQGAPLVILDESVSSLDPQTLRATMGFLWNQGPALVLIAHL